MKEKGKEKDVVWVVNITKVIVKMIFEMNGACHRKSCWKCTPYDWSIMTRIAGIE